MAWYTSDPTYDMILLIAFGYAALIALGARFGKASYGVFSSARTKLNLQPQLGWLLMELPASLSFLYFYLQGQNRWEPVPLFFLFVWMVHYGNRGFIFPLRMRVPKGLKRDFHISVVLFGWIVTILHGYLNATFISELSDQYTTAWLTDPRFLIGIAIYYTGFITNVHSESIIRNLRSKEEAERGENVFRIPNGGLFRWISSATYATEILSWIGFAIATWALGAVFVLLVTAANLIPRAFQMHRWYQKEFPDYPKERKALIPFIC
jgi:3-oxo-5-alpha-steroid 4-dehydrogenase 1